jgi:hypothetical protein
MISIKIEWLHRVFRNVKENDVVSINANNDDELHIVCIILSQLFNFLTICRSCRSLEQVKEMLTLRFHKLLLTKTELLFQIETIYVVRLAILFSIVIVLIINNMQRFSCQHRSS